MAGLEAEVVGRNPVQCLPAGEDNFGGVVVDVRSLSPTDAPAFVDSLHLSLKLWRSQKKKGVWLKLPTEYSLFVRPAIQEGFKFHHAESEYAMLVHWLSDEPSTLPANASHHVGVGAFVLNDRQEILAVQEKYGPFHDKWTMPTGRVRQCLKSQGEDIFAGAIRELEETGIDTEFVEVVGFRQSHLAPFGKSDVFFLCVPRPLSSIIQVQESELTDAKWLPLAEFQAQKYPSERKMLKRMLDEAKLNFIQSVGNTLSGDLAVQPGLAKTYAILFRNLLNANLPRCERWKNWGRTMSLHLRNGLKKVLSMPFRDLSIVCNGLGFLKSTSKLAVGMVLIGNTPAVGAVRAMAPEAAAPGSWDFEKSSNFAFGLINSVGALFSIIAVLIAVRWRRRHSIAGTSAASAPADAILNRPVNMAQTLTVVRSWRETEYCEVMVASRKEEGAYAS